MADVKKLLIVIEGGRLAGVYTDCPAGEITLQVLALDGEGAGNPTQEDADMAAFGMFRVHEGEE